MVKLMLVFNDRVGIVADISARIAERGLNIVAMEVVRQNEEAHVFLEADSDASGADRKEIQTILSTIPNLKEFRFIETLPQEERENRFRVVLDNVSDGVVSIDKQGRITTINKVARRVFSCKAAEVIGRDIKRLGLPEYPILECLRGKRLSHVKQNLIVGKGRYQYFSTFRPIRDSFDRIIGAVEIAKDMQEIKILARSLSEPSEVNFSDIIGQAPAIKQAIAFAQRIASTDAIISIRGASGTGKELFARAIHTASGRPGLFIPINCAALPEQLLESELFGYVGGAFTGGKKEGKAGLFEVARDGTVLLDEIAEMPLSAQAKILRLIQEQSIRRIGGAKEIPVNTRIITATNRDLERLVDEKQFRQDLYYRINVLPIHIPPLNQRMEDIGLLVDHFLFQLASKLGQQIPQMTPAALDKLHGHDWPGNVRELKNVVERAAILRDGNTIKAECVLFSHEMGKNIHDVAQQLAVDRAKGRSLKKQVAAFERRIIAETLTRSRSIREAAKHLQISHTALMNKMRKYRLDRAKK